MLAAGTHIKYLKHQCLKQALLFWIALILMYIRLYLAKSIPDGYKEQNNDYKTELSFNFLKLIWRWLF